MLLQPAKSQLLALNRKITKMSLLPKIRLFHKALCLQIAKQKNELKPYCLNLK